MRNILTLILIIFTFNACGAQEKNNSQPNSALAVEDLKVGGPCEGCEAIYEYGNRSLKSIDTLPMFETTAPKLKITGVVYQSDALTPAANVILYIYHTNREGIYPTRGDETGWARRHGFIRGWAKTDTEGRYTFYTFRPGAYPNRRAPEHIHLTVKETGLSAYYLEDFLFEDDTLLTSIFKERLSQRGGSGVVKPIPQGDFWLVKRDLILGLNIPDYPKSD